MAQSVEENELSDKELEIYKFVDDMVRYIVEFRDFADPPPLRSSQDAFTDNIGKAILKLVQAPNLPSLDRQLNFIIGLCHWRPLSTFHNNAKEILSRLSKYVERLDKSNPHTYLNLLQVSCKLVVKFHRAGKKPLMYAISELLKTILRENQTDCATFRALDSHAAKVLVTLRNLGQ